ncbi:hypothetical protein TGVAND_438000 [Toxoplasma gondii VAND]|uniref:Uncharacterized protein n=1 Tax=Toxoplasma gondii VAND TaxID=933077 RepID=A0A086PMS5_TOXGO|nr:hypothetical protein TGVAND_438000 [Toxoplasma gondii VAND]
MADSKDAFERGRGTLLAAVPSAEDASATEESSGKAAESDPPRRTPASSETSTTPSREGSSASPTPVRVREAETDQQERQTQKGGNAEHHRQEGRWTRDAETGAPDGACRAAAPPESADHRERTAPPESADHRERTAPPESADHRERTAPQESADRRERTAPQESADRRERTAPQESVDRRERTAPQNEAFSAEELARSVTPREREVNERDGPGGGWVSRCSGLDSPAIKGEDRENSRAETPSEETDGPLQRGGSRKLAREMAAAKQVSSRHRVGDLEDDDDAPDVFMPATSSVARRRQGWPSRLSLQEKLRCLLAAAGGRFRQGLSFTEPRLAPSGGGEDAGTQREKRPAHASSPSVLSSETIAKTKEKEETRRRRVDETSLGRKAETPSPTDRPVQSASGRQLMSASPGARRRGGAEEETREQSVLGDGNDGEGGGAGARDNSEKQEAGRPRGASADALAVRSGHEACEEDAFFSLEDCFDEDHSVSLSAVRRDAERLAKYQEALEYAPVHPETRTRSRQWERGNDEKAEKKTRNGAQRKTDLRASKCYSCFF